MGKDFNPKFDEHWACTNCDENRLEEPEGPCVCGDWHWVFMSSSDLEERREESKADRQYEDSKQISFDLGDK